MYFTLGVDGWQNKDGNVPTVRSLEIRSYNYLPKMLSRTDLANWLQATKLKNVHATSYLDGAVFFDSRVFSDPSQTEEDVQTRIREVVRAAEAMHASHPELKPLDHARYAPTKVNLTTRLDSIEVRDIEFMEEQFGWQYRKGWGASSNGWIRPATINGTDYWFHEMVNPANHGVPTGHHGFYIGLDRSYAKEWTAGWVKANGASIKWAKAFDNGDGRLIITHFVDLTQSPSVSEIKADIESFDRNIQSLLLPRLVKSL